MTTGEIEHTHIHEPSREAIMTGIARLAHEQWELVSVVIDPSDSSWHAFFKRQVPVIPATTDNRS